MSVSRLDALGQEIASLLEWEHATTRAGRVFFNLTSIAVTHIDGLLDYSREHLDPLEFKERPPSSPATSTLNAAAPDASSTEPFDTYAVCTVGALRYARLATMALRLFDPALRELAPTYQQHYADAAFRIAEDLSSVVVSQLADRDLECHCVCPMCSLGLCGCVAVGRSIATRHLREIDEGVHPTGFSIPNPRASSQLADAGCRGGQRLLEIDGRPVQTVADIQSAIRRHAVGESLVLLIDDGITTRAVHVTHVHDYS